MFQHAFIQQLGHGKLGREEALILEDCQRRGLQATLFMAKQMQRRQLPLHHHSFVCGDVNVMHGAMKQLGIEPPAPNDFPSCLEPFLHRRVWRSSVAELVPALEAGRELFAKPAGRTKLFTGRVFSSSEDRYHVGGISRHEPLWCSEVVEWRAEFRVYVLGTDILSIDHYGGDPGLCLDKPTLQAAILAYSQSGQAPAAYGIDFGVLSTGETALVEANDGFSLGAYHIDSASYARLLYARWAELLSSASLP